jgi:hypothetical protein
MLIYLLYIVNKLIYCCAIARIHYRGYNNFVAPIQFFYYYNEHRNSNHVWYLDNTHCFCQSFMTQHKQ